MKICELMKNHIKNYIKIMGLAAVPFGTAQAEAYEIKVTQESKHDAEHFKISLAEKGKEPKVVEVVWPHDKEYPNPIFESNGFIRHYSDETKREARYLFGLSLVDNVRMFSAIPLDKWRNFYDVKSFSDGQL